MSVKKMKEENNQEVGENQGFDNIEDAANALVDENEQEQEKVGEGNNAGGENAEGENAGGKMPKVKMPKVKIKSKTKIKKTTKW